MKSATSTRAIHSHIIAKISLVVTLTLLLSSPVAWSQSQPSINDLFVQIGNVIPGFGGMYVDPDQDTLYVYVVPGLGSDLSQLDATITDVLGDSRPLESQLVVLPAQYTFQQLKSWQDYSDSQVLYLPGVVSTGIQNTTNRLRIGVANALAMATVQSEMSTLGIPSDAFEIVPETPPDEQACTSVRSQCRPVVGGLQIHADKDPAATFSTLSFNATRAGVAGFVTCSHCGNVAFQNTGTVYDQNLLGNAKIGTEISNPPLVAALGGGRVCPKDGEKPGVCRLSDSSFAQYVNGANVKVGFIARPALDKVDWNGTDYFRIIAFTKSIEGEKVAKVGRTTGFTEGKITGICRNLPVPALRKKATDPLPVLVCQNTADYDSDFGDSGSPVFLCSTTKDGCSKARIFDVQLLGVHNAGKPHGVAGDRWYSDIGLIMDNTTELGPLTKFCDPAVKNPTCS